MFGTIRCSHCGEKISLEEFCFLDNSLLCQNCGKLGEGESCGICFRFDVKNGVCTVDDLERTANTKCSISDVAYSLRRRRPTV